MTPEKPPPLPQMPSDGSAPRSRWWQPAVVNVRWCVIVNLLGCPGLGTIMARQRGGYLQLACMLTGTCLLVGFMVSYARALVRLFQSANPESGPDLSGHYWLLGWGGGLCVAAWIASAFSSWRLWQSQKRQG